MEEKYMVNDILENSKNEIKTITDIIVQTENIDLRQVFQTIRVNQESFEYELSKLRKFKRIFKHKFSSKTRTNKQSSRDFK